MDALLLHRIHFGFTITYHYLFPQLTMGLALLIVALKSIALWHKNERYNEAARFWAKIFAINFLLGVVTGIPMEFQFGTNWSQFSRTTGGVIGQPLAMEGVFSFFLESAFLGLFIFGEKRLAPWAPLGFRFYGVCGFVDFRIFYHRNQRLDATPRRLPGIAQWRVRGHQLLGTAHKSMGVDSVFPQHVGLGNHRRICNVRRRRLLCA